MNRQFTSAAIVIGIIALVILVIAIFGDRSGGKGVMHDAAGAVKDLGHDAKRGVEDAAETTKKAAQSLK